MNTCNERYSQPVPRPLDQARRADVMVALREQDGADDAWREARGESCATVRGGGSVVVWVGSQRAGQPVDVTISRQD